MTIFRTYFKVMKKYSAMLILYTALLVAFAAFQMQTSGDAVGFAASKPDIFVINEDADSTLSQALCAYLDTRANVKTPDDTDDAVSDALFYRDVSYIITILDGFEKTLLAGGAPEVDVQSVGDYEAAYAAQLLEEWLTTAQASCGAADTAAQSEDAAEKIADAVADTLAREAETVTTTALDTGALSDAAFYFNFLNYSLLAGCVYVIAVVLSSFRTEGVKRRTRISATRLRTQNLQLLLANAVFALVLWTLYIVLAFVLLKETMCSVHGLLLAANSFVFMLCALSVGFLIGNLTTNKGALSGIINVVALGSSFLCGAFVPVRWLPDWVLAAAHVLPSYWFIQNNEAIADLEQIDLASLRPLFLRGAIMLLFAALFVLCTHVLSRLQREKMG